MKTFARGVVLSVVVLAFLMALTVLRAQTLGISSSGTNVIVSWTGSNAWLQSTVALDRPDEWINASQVMDLGSGASVLFPTDQDQEFFRLVYSPNLPPPTRAFLDVGNGFFYVYWDAVATALSYNLYYATEPGVTPATYQSLAGGALVSGITDTFDGFSNLVAGVTYYFVVTAVNASGESVPSGEVSGTFGPNSGVEGSVYTTLFQQGESLDVGVEGVLISLINSSTSQTAATVATDGDGDFEFPPQPYGMYQLCWSAPGFIPGCSNQLISVAGNDIQLDPLEIFPNPGPSNNFTTVYGHISMADGSSPVQSDPFTEINVQAVVSLLDTNGATVRQTEANSDGDYSFAGVPTGTNYQLVAQVEASQIATNISTALVGEVDLVFPIYPPVIQSVTVLSNGQPVNSIAPGSAVQIQCIATDPNGYSLQYEWFEVEAHDSLTDTNDQTAMFEATTNDPSLLEVEVRVSNGHGGYAVEKFDSPITGAFLLSGNVVDTNGDPIFDATVEVGANVLSADTNGYFVLSVPTMQTNIPVAITAPGYLPLFQLEPTPQTGVQYTLLPVVFSMTTNSNCGNGPLTVNDSGTSIQLQPCSVIDGSGQPYMGQFTVTINPYDPCDFSSPFPAGNAGVNGSGQSVFVEPVAAANIEITDSNGLPLMIDSNLPALVTLTTGPTCAPPTNSSSPQPTWYLDPVSGVWRPLPAQANPQAGPPAVWVFPVAQLGLLAVGEAPASAVITIFPDRTLNVPFEVRISALREPVLIENSKTPTEDTIVGNTVKVPQNQPLTIDVINQKEGPGVYYTNPLVPASMRTFPNKTAIVEVKVTVTTPTLTVPVSLSQYITNLTGARVDGANQFLTFRAPPLGGVVNGKARESVDTYYDTIARFAVNRSTLGAFLAKNGFTPDAGSFTGYSEDAGAVYFNAQDLGFARSMHMKTSAGADGKTNIAYFVINYVRVSDALVDVDASGRLTNISGGVDGRQTAVVAMDYAWDPRFNKRYTKFYVFDGTVGGTLRDAADLDGAGNKYVPNLCVTCHGGDPVKIKALPFKSVWPSGRIGVGSINTNYLFKDAGLDLSGLAAAPSVIFSNMTTTDGGTGTNGRQVLVCNPPDGDTGSYFLPFDIESFTYTEKLGVQQANFRALNAGIYQYSPTTTAMKQLLEGWYGGAVTATNNNTFKTSFIPASWSPQPAIYQEVNKLTCRACHCTRSGDEGFAAWTNFNAVVKRAGKSTVCQKLKMPNAQRNFSIFWGSQCANYIKAGSLTNQPAILTNQYGWSPCPTLAP